MLCFSFFVCFLAYKLRPSRCLDEGALIGWNFKNVNFRPDCNTVCSVHNIVLAASCCGERSWLELMEVNPRVLEETLLEAAEDLRPGWRFTSQHDNDPKHVSIDTMKWFGSTHIHVFGWPNPDLNPSNPKSMANLECWGWCLDALYSIWLSFRCFVL